jgi:hypothetical protein
VLARCLGHRQPALAYEPDGLLDADRRCSRQRCELADRVADDVVGLDAARLERGEDGETRGDERRLLHLGLDELVEVRVEAQPREVES